MDELVELIVRRLLEAGYSLLPHNFAVTSVEFSFDAALQGKDGRSKDLVLVFDVTRRDEDSDAIGTRIQYQVEALSRALDVAGSGYVLTVVLAGPPIRQSHAEAITRYCRVLSVEGPAKKKRMSPELEDRLRVLLPLAVTSKEDFAIDPLQEVLDRLPTNLSVSVEVAEILEASGKGGRVVEATLRRLLEAALRVEDSP